MQSAQYLCRHDTYQVLKVTRWQISQNWGIRRASGFMTHPTKKTKAAASLDCVSMADTSAAPSKKQPSRSDDDPSKRQRIEHLEQAEWLLMRPETFIGAMEPVETSVLDFGVDGGAVGVKTEVLCPAVFSLTKELVDNAIDNCRRDDTQRYIKIEWKDGGLTVTNDGSTLPVEKDARSGKWAITLAFAEFQSGSNFDDSQGQKQARFTAGRNGVGSKGCNVMSTKFAVRISNSQDKKTFAQMWEHNMKTAHPPKITACSRKKNETVVTWHPDFERLGGESSMHAMPDICRWYAHNASLCVPGSVKVHFNDELIKLRTPEHFCAALGGVPPFASDVFQREGQALLRICVAARGPAAPNNLSSLSSGHSLTYAFVNGTPCCEGTHAKYIASKVGEIIDSKAKGKRAKPGSDAPHATPSFLHSHTVIVATLLVEKERFTDQRKRVLDTPLREWGWKWDPSTSFVSAIHRSELADQLILSCQEKSDAAAAKATKTTSRQLNIAKYEPALKRFTPTATLIVCEGDSAGNLVRSGLTVVGRKDFGLYPLRGKFLNVRGAPAKTVLDNKEAVELLKILGIQLNTTYDDDTVKKLPYSRLMVMTDQDVDGSHIMGLLFNFVDACAPSLLRQKPNYLCRFATSLIRVTVKQKEIGFYSQVEYDNWVQEQLAKGQGVGTPQYFKGLGTSSAAQAKQYFRNLSANTITLIHDGPQSAESLDLAFNKRRADDRKEFLTDRCDPLAYVDYSRSETTVQDFVHNELLPQYALASLRRAIPALDGFKEAHRKVFYGARSLRLTSDISVANAAGKISSHTNYHHRGTAMEDTIIGMAADYAGCSNMNLLCPHGQFGTRHKHAAASAAYPKVCLSSPLHELLFPVVDDSVLQYMVDEGKRVEPVMFAPIIPMPIVFGCHGIATGWSTSVPMFHPLDVLRLTEDVILQKDPSSATHGLLPWYRGFHGVVEEVETGTFLVKGSGEWRGSDFHVTEIPPFRETEAFKEDWNKADVAPGGIVPGDGHTDDKVHLVLKGCKPMENPIEELGLTKKVSLNNMHLLDTMGKLRKYDTVVDIVKDYCEFRLEIYVKRLASMIRRCEKEVLIASNRARFIRAYVDGEYDMRTYPDDQAACDACRQMGFDECCVSDDDKSQPSYNYLLTMPLRSLTGARAATLAHEAQTKQEELKVLRNEQPVGLWMRDLEKLKAHVQGDAMFAR